MAEKLRSTVHALYPRFAIVSALMICWLCGCSRSSPDVGKTDRDLVTNAAVTVYAVNYPLQYFAQRIGGEHVRVVFPAPPNEDPAFWRPGAETISDLQQADLILLNGASYAKWTRAVTLPESKIVDTSEAFEDQYIRVQDAVTHSHGPDAQHSHEGTAFTTWLDFRLAIGHAQAIQQALTQLRPQHQVEFEQNFTVLEEDLRQLDAKLAGVVKDAASTPLFFSHPVFQYLQKRYDLNAKSVHWEPEQEPTQKMWDEFAAVLGGHSAKWMVWEGQPSERTVQRLAELGVQSTVYDPCGNKPATGDFLTTMKQNIKNLSAVLAP